MKKLLVFSVFTLLFSIASAQQNCDITLEKPIRLLTTELERGMPVFKKLDPPVYYLSYTYSEEEKGYITVRNGGVASRWEGRNNLLKVQARVGNTQMDNTRLLKNDYSDYSAVRTWVPLSRKGGKGFSTVLWWATEEAIIAAQRKYDKVKSDQKISSERGDDSDDFVIPPTEKYCHTESFPSFDTDKIQQLLLKASEEIRGQKEVLDSDFSFSKEEGHRYFVDSNGTQLKTPFQFVRLGYVLENKTKEGYGFQLYKSYDVTRMEELPTEEQLLADVRQTIDLLKQLTTAPDAEPITVPAILKNKAMGVFVHEVLGHRLEGHRQKEDSFGKTFTTKIGQQILPSFLTLVADPTVKTFQGKPMRGYYEFDDEGVKARPVVLVENGVLKNFLMSSSPIKGFPVSNGHGRSDSSHRSVARMSHLVLTSSKTVSYEELERQLIEEVKKQGKPYGIIIEDLSGGYTFTETFLPQTFKLHVVEMYRVYPDGRKELVRGGEIAGTPLVSFNEILVTADDYGIFNGSCGAESGWVPQSEVAPSVLLRNMEVELTAKETDRLPILKSPYAEGAK